MKRVLILHGSSYVSRATTLSQLRALGRVSNCEVHYHHLSAPVTSDLRSYPFNGIIINYCFIMQRQAGYQEQLISQYDWLREHPAVKIALPMDDCYRSAFIEDWCTRLGVSVLYTPLYADRSKIYPNIINTVDIRPALTGYVDEEQLPLLIAAAKKWNDRQIDVGTRVAKSPYAHGRYAIIKADYAESFADAAPAHGIRCDISTKPEDALVGADWYEFLGNCRATIGMKGGYGLVDPRGDLRAASTKYLSENPGAKYDEVAAVCFVGHDHNAEYSCISPRIFECAATRTVQIMPPSNYLECLSPWTHYIPLSLDLSDIEDVKDALSDEKLCSEISGACYDTLIQSGWFTHHDLVSDIFSQISPLRGSSGVGPALSEYSNVIRDVKECRDKLDPIVQVSLAHIFLYSKLHGAERHLDAFSEFAIQEDCFILPFHMERAELGQYGKDWFSASYVGQINLIRGLGLLSGLVGALRNAPDERFGPLSYWNWAFSGSEPEIKSMAEAYPSERHMQAARGQYEELVRSVGTFSKGDYQQACVLALFAWSRGDYASAKRIGLDALDSGGTPRGSEEALAAHGIASALLGMMSRMNDTEGIACLDGSKSILTDHFIIDAINQLLVPVH